MTRGAVAIALALALGGCGERVTEVEPTSVEHASESAGGEAPATASFGESHTASENPDPWPGRTGLGTKLQSPVSACGPADSYRFVALEFQCPEGGNPLGELARGAGARVGNVGENASGHIIDLYRVPCGGGDVDVFVDMYGCPEMEAQLRGMGGQP